ncbi:MAG: DUF362 domain-containing protein [Candidatus Jordarchaeum sp.]|uniref:DUF362 domain-containing protein n=1 Tax=Candidatus Jordarchaeum sp. TaxID=2823881 RepID=UPI00404ADE4C
MPSIVSVVKGHDPEKVVPKSVDLLGGVAEIVDSGDTVLIKPNIMEPMPPETAAVVDPKIVEEIVKLVKSANPRKIIVGESPAYNFKARDAFKVSGIGEIVKKLGAEISYFDEEPYVEVDVPNGRILESIELPKTVVESDVLINVAKMKTHGLTGATLAIKNLHGLLQWKDKWFLAHKTDIFYKLADIIKAVKEKLKLSFIDGIVAMEGQGPALGDIIEDMDVVVAGKDIVAVDAVASAVMGFQPLELPMTQVAANQGLGNADLYDIEVKGETIESVQRHFKRPIISYVSDIPNVTLYIGGVCQACLTRYNFFMPEVDENKTYVVIMGCNPIIPRDVEVDEVHVIGECAVKSANDLMEKFGDAKIVMTEGCPPMNEIVFRNRVEERLKFICGEI